MGYTGTDPVTGQLVRSGELVKASPAEVDEYLKHYNELDQDKDRDGAPAGGGGGGGAAAEASAGDAGGGSRGEVNEAFGADGGAADKNGEGRAKDSAPVASAGAGLYRQNLSGRPAAG